MEYILAHSTELLAITATVLSLAALVVKLTPNTKDDAIVAKVEDVIGKYLPKTAVAK